jgi:hypothetical protein
MEHIAPEMEFKCELLFLMDVALAIKCRNLIALKAFPSSFSLMVKIRTGGFFTCVGITHCIDQIINSAFYSLI